MLNTRLEHQQTFKVPDHPHMGNMNNRRRSLLENNQIEVQLHSTRYYVENKIVSIEDLLIDKYT